MAEEKRKRPPSEAEKAMNAHARSQIEHAREADRESHQHDEVLQDAPTKPAAGKDAAQSGR